MRISDEKWDEIVAEVEDDVRRWEARGKVDRFYCEVLEVTVDEQQVAVLLTTHVGSGTTERQAVARELGTGELRPAKAVIRNGQHVGFRIKPDPKAWQKLTDKPTAVIVSALHLTNFFIAISDRVIGAAPAR